METNKKSGYLPGFLDNLNIGKPIPVNQGGAYFEGDLKKEEDLVEVILGGPASLTLHENGIRICNIYYENKMDIHFSQLINLSSIDEEIFVEKDRPIILEVLFALLVVLTLGFILAVGLGMLSESRRHGVNVIAPFLVIHFWDVVTNREKELHISGRRHKIEKFIRRQQVASGN